MPMTAFRTTKPTSAWCSNGDIIVAGSARPGRDVGGLPGKVAGSVRLSPVDLAEDGIDGAHDGHDVGHLVTGDDVGQDREVRERGAAPLQAVRLGAAVGDDVAAELPARPFHARVALALGDPHLS